MSKRSRNNRTKPSRSNASKSQKPASVDARKLSARKKLLFATVAVVSFFGVVELLLMLLGVQPQITQRDPFVGFAGKVPLFVASPDNPAMLETATNKLAWFNRQSFSRTKPTNTYRIVCLGGSTTYGRPYDDTTSFAGWLRELLPELDPSRTWEVINAGGISYASYRVALVAEELAQYEPDLFIVYTGHNEYLEDRTYADVKQTSPVIQTAQRWLSHTRTYAAMERALRPSDASTPSSADHLLPAEVATKLDQGIGPDAFTRDDQQSEQIARHFRHNLNRLVQIAISCESQIIFVKPASNLKDCSPFKSELQSAGDDLTSSNAQIQFAGYLRSAKEYITKREHQEAVTHLKQAVALDPRHAHAHYLMGRCMEHLGEFEAAKQSYQDALEQDICPLRANRSLQSIVQSVSQQHETGYVDFAKRVEDWSQHELPGDDYFLDHVHPTIDGHFRLALLITDEFVRLGIAEPQDAWNEQAQQRVLELVTSRMDQTQHANALRNLAKVMSWAGKQEEADRLALRAAELNQDDGNAQYLAASAKLKQGQVQEAIRMLRQVVEKAPDHSMATLTLGAAYQAAGQPELAATAYQKALEIDPNNSVGHNNLGAFYSARKRWDQAEEHLRRAIALQPRYAKAHYNLGVLHARRGQSDLAINSMLQSVEIDSGQAAAHAQLGDLYRSQQAYTNSVRHYRDALRIAPNRLMTANSLAWILATCPLDHVRDGSEALRWAKHCVEGTEYKNPGAFNTLAAAYAESGDFAKALEWQKKAHAAVPPGPAKTQSEKCLKLYELQQPYRE